MTNALTGNAVRFVPYSTGDVFYGSWKALRGEGIVPTEQLDPPAPRRGGAWLTDANGRHLRISRSFDGYKVTRSITREERTRRQQIKGSTAIGEQAGRRARERLQTVEASLRAWSDCRAQFNAALINLVNDAIESKLKQFAWSDSPCRGPWTFAPGQEAAVDEARRVSNHLLTSIEMVFDEGWRGRMEQERSMLMEDPQGDPELRDAIEAVNRIRQQPSRGIE